MEKRTPFRWARASALGLVMFAAAACGTESCSCSGFEQRPFPTEHVDKTQPHGAQVRLTASGITFLEDHFSSLLSLFLPGGLSFCLPQQEESSPEYCFGDEVCTDGSEGCQVELTIEDVELTPRAPSQLDVKVTIGSLDERIPFKGYGLRCWARLHKPGNKDEPGTVVGATTVRFVPDPSSPIGAIRLEVADLEPDLAGVDFRLSGYDGWWDDTKCFVARALKGTVRRVIEDLISGMLQDQIQPMLDGFLCRGCSVDDPATDVCPQGSSCVDDGDNVACRYDGTQEECVPTALGVGGAGCCWARCWATTCSHLPRATSIC